MIFSKLLLPACLMMTMPAFVGPVHNHSENSPDIADTVKIGLLISDNKSFAARDGAMLAVKKVNETGGMNGRPVKLIVRSMEGPWGTGSKQAVNLIFEDDVFAILGSHDGRNAHLVEQVCAKSRVVFLSAWASDPSLSQAFVPWYFSCVPNDIQQADALIDEIYNKRKISNVIIISDNGYDSKQAVKFFLNTAKKDGREIPTDLSSESSEFDLTRLSGQAAGSRPGCVVLIGKPGTSISLIKQMKQLKSNQPVYSTLSILEEKEIPENYLELYEGISIISSCHWLNKEGISFSEGFQRSFGYYPGAGAAYAFDGMNVLIGAITKSGADRDRLQAAMMSTRYDGVTGPIRFDGKGNRMGTPCLMKIKNGIPIIAE